MKTNPKIAMVLTVIMGTTLIARADHIDDQIMASAKKSYTFRHDLNKDHVKVYSSRGIVTLTGTVSSEFHKQLAYETVAAMSQVTKVNDELKVTGKQPDANSDAWVGIQVKNVLRFHGNVSVVTHVDVKNGVVTLHGKAYSEAQRELAGDYAMDIEGVKSVNNKMTVMNPPGTTSPVENMDDASLTADVKLSLLWHRSTSVVISHVKTVNGVVTVAGNCKTSAEKERVTQIVAEIDGVKSVVNNLTY